MPDPRPDELTRTPAADTAAPGLPGPTLPGSSAFGKAASASDPTDTAVRVAPPGYELLGEAGRGGMGVVYRARDLRLDRDVAVKLLQDRYPADGPAVRRFVDEARITGQLQHPGIPPVFEVGTLPDGRPFLAMKLIKGQTLDALLNDRPDPAADRGRFVAAFEQVCQAVGYAHSRDVIHRDLKPSNVMVGAFGEVQVMDWGLAKVLTGGPASPAAGGDARGTEVRTDRLPGSGTQTGSILGTPAFMSPEQAAGETDKVDERADVFGLGGVLATVLTGSPPYDGPSADAIRVMAIRGQLADCFARLDASGADPELVGLCKRCLATDRDDRPADAGEVARAVAGLRAAADDRARQAERDRVAAEVRAKEERKRRRVQLVLGSAVVLGLLVGGGVAAWQWRRAEDALGRTTVEQDRTQDALKRVTAEEGNTRAALAAVTAEQKKTAAALTTAEAAQDRTWAALRAVTTRFVGEQLGRQPNLTDRDREFLTGILRLWRTAADARGDGPDALSLRAEGAVRVGMIQVWLGELAEAEQAFDDGLTAYRLRDETRAGEEFGDTYLRAYALLYVAGIRESTGRSADAERDYQEAIRLLRAVPSGHRLAADARFRLAYTLSALGTVRSNRKDLAEAEKYHREALAIFRELTGGGAAGSDFVRLHMGRTLTSLGLTLKRAQRPAESDAATREALDIFRGLAARHPDEPDYLGPLARAHANLGGAALDARRTADAERELGEALTRYRKLFTLTPGILDHRFDLVGVLVNVAKLKSRRKEFAAARALLDEARPHMTALLKVNAAHPGYRQYYRNLVWGECVALYGLQDREALAAAAAELGRVRYDPALDPHNAACFLARCSRLASQDNRLTAEKRAELARRHADDAMDLLRQAVKAGLRDTARLAEEPLNPLRGRADFQELLAEVEGKTKR